MRKRRVVLAIIDGLRPDAITPEVMPSLAALRAEGWFAHGTTVRPSVTAAALTSLATGVSPATHSITAPQLPTLAALRRVTPLPLHLRRHGHSVLLATNGIAFARRLLAEGLLRFAGISRIAGSGSSPADVGRDAVRGAEAVAPSLVAAYVDHVDKAGHAHGWMSAPYLDAARRADALVAALRPLLDDGRTTLLVTADHGGGGVEPHDHDLPHPVNDRIPVIAVGAAVRPGEGDGCSLLDLPPTVLHLLGVPVPPSWEGRVLGEALATVGSGVAVPGLLAVA